MDARRGSQERFARGGGGKPVLAEAPPVDRGEPLELDSAELLTRLEDQAAEKGRLEAKVDALEQKVRSERDARRRLASTLQKEREAAAALHERAEEHRAAHNAAHEDLERAREEAWSRLADSQRPVATHEHGFWHGLFRRPPRA